MRRRKAIKYLKYYSSVGVTPSYSTEYQEVLAKATLEGIALPDDEQKASDDQFIEDLRTAGILGKAVLRYLLQSSAVSGFTRINLANPSSNFLNPVASPVYSSGVGWTSAGDNSYLSTGYTKGLALSNNISISWKTDQVAAESLKMPWGARSSSGVRMQVIQRTAGNQVNGSVSLGAVVLDDGPVTTANQFMTVTCDGVNIRFYKNGVLIKTLAGAANGNVVHELVLLAQNNAGTIDNEFTTHHLKYFEIGQWLDDTQALALYNAYTAREVFFLVDPL
jgi:hypothetical protein